MNNRATLLLSDGDFFKEKLNFEENFKIPTITEKLTEKDFLELPLISGNLGALFWGDGAFFPIASMVLNQCAESFFKTQPLLLSFFKQENIFETIIINQVSSISMPMPHKKDFNKMIQTFKKIHPGLNLNTQEFYDGTLKMSLPRQPYNGKKKKKEPLFAFTHGPDG